MKNFLLIENWSRLSSNETDYQNFLAERRNVLFSRFCIAGTLAAILQGAHDVITGFPLVMLIDLILAGLLLIGFIMNEKRIHRISKMLVFLGVMLILFGFAAVVPRGVGIFMLYFPIVAFSFISFDYSDRKISLSLALLALILNILLLVTDYQPFGSINLQPINPSSSFAINLIISIGLIVLGIDFLLRINYQAEEKLIENKLEAERLALEINDKNLSLEKTNEELDRFVYSTSHDLRSPLASIMGLINLTEMSKEEIPEEIKKYLLLMRDRVNNLDGFIQDIIDYSRNSRVDLVLSPIDVAKMVDEVILHNQFLENSSRVTITNDVQIDQPKPLDGTRLSRVLNNLVSNAIKYNDPQKDNPFVIISGRVIDGEVVLTVKDSGHGIRPEIKDKIFDMFYRGTESTDGSGLGLYITREMVQKMKGSLTFESYPGQGTTFTLKLPFSELEETSA